MNYLKWRGHAKDILYNFSANRILLQQMRADVLYGRSDGGEQYGRRSGISNPTYCKMSQLTQGRTAQLAREVAAVESLLRSLASGRRDDAKKQTVLEMIYFNNTHTLYGAAAILGLSERTILRWNQEFLTKIAAELDWI
ncbi:MAG: hypothetical protein RR387_06690 [Clostridiales bacterium]